MKTNSWLIVGGDGLIGGGLARHASSAGQPHQVSRRRPLRAGDLSLDLAAGDFAAALALKPQVVFICAAITGMQACHDDPQGSARVNVSGSFDLIAAFMRQGAFVVFLSSNTVFDGNTPWPAEKTAYKPANEYGRQKAAAEARLLSLPEAAQQLAIVRLSKVLAGAMGTAGEFIRRLSADEPCSAFSDLLLCPVSLQYVTRALTVIGNWRHPGIFHLSGEKELSYAQLALLFAHRLQRPTKRVEAIDSRDSGVAVPFRPLHPGLGMTGTTAVFGLQPQPIAEVMDDLFLEAALQ